MNETTEYELSAEEREMLQEVTREAQQTQMALQGQVQGMLRLILKQQKLAGNFVLSADLVRLVKTPDPVPTAARE